MFHHQLGKVFPLLAQKLVLSQGRNLGGPPDFQHGTSLYEHVRQFNFALFNLGREKSSYERNFKTSCRACAILVPNQELKLCPLPWKLRVLITGPPGKLRATFYDGKCVS